MTDETPPPPKKKKGKLKLLVLILGGAGALATGGVAAGMYFGAGSGTGGAIEDPNRPRLVLKDGKEAPYAAVLRHGREGGIDPRDAGKYQASYLPLDQSFTSNMRDTDGIMQVGLGVSTYYDQRVLDSVKRDDMPIRSAILMTLADQDSFGLSTPEGKKALRKSLKDAINQVLVQKEGFGGIDDVYFTSLIIQ